MWPVEPTPRSWPPLVGHSNAPDLSPEAEAEIVETIEFYRSRSPEFAARFLRAFESAIELIEENPLRWAPIQDDLRRVLLRRFPFCIYDRIEDQELRVLIVKHHRRHPDYGMDRLDS